MASRRCSSVINSAAAGSDSLPQGGQFGLQYRPGWVISRPLGAGPAGPLQSVSDEPGQPTDE